MRLTCPNCGARYEVDDAMVPPQGRDVQCSNCATTWFQTGPGGATEPAAVYIKRVIQAGPAQPAATGAAAPADPPEDEDHDDATEADPADGPAPDMAERLPRREIDPAVRDILRQEAEREARLRRGAAASVETQSEMPFDDSRKRAPQLGGRAELEAARDAFEDPEDDTRRNQGARRDLLPDIEDINSTLRATSDRSPEETTASDIETLDRGPRRRRGARAGFVIVLLIAGTCAGVYANAELIASELPETAPYIATFVEQVNAARFWLDSRARDLVEFANSV